VLGISADSRPTLAAYTLSLGPSLSYPIPLLSDFHPHGRMIRSYGLYNEEKGTSLRAVVIVDTEGNIRFKRTYTPVLKAGPTGQGEVETDLDPADILAEVEKIQRFSTTRTG
jgi:peroxiredoxin